MAKRHLQLRGFPASVIKNLKIKLPEPSDMSEKRKLDVDEQKTRVIQAVQGLNLFSKESIYREFYDMTEDEIRRMKSEIEGEQQQEQQDQQAMGAGPGPGEAGGQEPAENAPPTANESVEYALKFVADTAIDEKAKEVLQRIVEKQQQKAETTNSEESI
jgi:hypothetical protein